MAEGEYTSLDFLSKLRTGTKKHQLFRHLSLNQDLEEINNVLNSPRGMPEKKFIPPAKIDAEQVKVLLREVLIKYETEQVIESKWDGFIKSVGSQKSFGEFVDSLKEIKIQTKPEGSTNPQKQDSKEQQLLKKNQNKKQRLVRASSSKGLNTQKIAQKKQDSDADKLRNAIRAEISNLKDIILAGEQFIHSH